MCLLCQATGQAGIGEMVIPFLGIGALFFYDKYYEIKSFFRRIPH